MSEEAGRRADKLVTKGCNLFGAFVICDFFFVGRERDSEAKTMTTDEKSRKIEKKNIQNDENDTKMMKLR